MDAFDGSWTTRTLANGMLAVHVPDPHSDAFSVGMVVRCGSRREPARIAGVSHFLEHVLFRGSERFPGYTRLASEFEWLGGDWNAATGHEQTEYAYAGIERTSTEAIELFAEFLERPRLADVDVERAIILRELEGETNEFGHNTDLDLHAARMLWPGTALARPILGTPETLARIDRDALRAWRDRHYVPRNLAVYAAGGEDGDDTLDRLARAFEGHRAGFARRRPRAPAALPEPRGGRVRWVEHSDNEYDVRLTFPCSGETSPDAAVHEVLVRILSDGFCARLPRRLREELGLVYDVGAHIAHLTDVGMLDVHATVRLDQFETFFRELYRELHALATDGPGREETARSVLRAVVDLELAPDDPERAAARVAWDGLHGRPTSFAVDRARLEAVTVEDVRRVAGALFRTDRAALAVLGPADPGLEDRLRAELARGLPGAR
jgi:predicted Zn-dependent peptidase